MYSLNRAVIVACVLIVKCYAFVVSYLTWSIYTYIFSLFFLPFWSSSSSMHCPCLAMWLLHLAMNNHSSIILSRCPFSPFVIYIVRMQIEFLVLFNSNQQQQQRKIVKYSNVLGESTQTTVWILFVFISILCMRILIRRCCSIRYSCWVLLLLLFIFGFFIFFFLLFYTHSPVVGGLLLFFPGFCSIIFRNMCLFVSWAFCLSFFANPVCVCGLTSVQHFQFYLWLKCCIEMPNTYAN